MDTSVAVAVVGFFTAVVTGVFAVFKIYIEKSKTRQAKNELKLQRTFLSFADFIEEWDSLLRELTDLMSETTIDRFIILRAWNGVLAPKWTTAIYQMRQGNQKPISYVHFELDNDYVSKIYEIMEKGSCSFYVDKMEPSALRDVYTFENVTQALWVFINAVPFNDSSRAITYCTFATHDPTGIPEHVVTRCKIISARLKHIVNDFFD